MVYLWIFMFILFAVVEAATAQLVSIWFAVGALAAFITSLFLGDDRIVIQLAVFVVTSVLSFFITRPLVRKFTKVNIQPTNADMVIGRTAVVTEQINNNLGTGTVTINGMVWTARSKDNSIIDLDTEVTIEAIEGVKLMVSRAEVLK